MPSQVIVSGTLTGTTGPIHSEFVGAYDRKYDGVKADLAPVMMFDLPASKREETFAYFETAPYPRLWKRGDALPYGTFESASFSVLIHDFASGVNWHEDDEQDEQTNSLGMRARSAGENFALLYEEFFFQVMLGASSTRLLPAVPNAPDGAALYSTTDGASADRFGVSGGNIVSGQTLTTSAGIRAAVFECIERAQQFQDTEGQPLWSRSLIDQGITIFHNVANSQIVAEAMVQGRTLQVQAGTSTTDTSTAAAVTNVILDSGFKIRTVGTQRISGNNLYVFFNGSPHKAIFTMLRQPLRATPFDRNNSDRGRDYKEKGITYDNRVGVGVFLPYQTVEATA